MRPRLKSWFQMSYLSFFFQVVQKAKEDEAIRRRTGQKIVCSVSFGLHCEDGPFVLLNLRRYHPRKEVFEVKKLESSGLGFFVSRQVKEGSKERLPGTKFGAQLSRSSNCFLENWLPRQPLAASQAWQEHQEQQQQGGQPKPRKTLLPGSLTSVTQQ